MRIGFLTSCLEPGRDGVGDYTRLLAAECKRRGHEVAMMALRDQYQIQFRDDTTMRLQYGLEHDGQITMAGDFWREFQPDVLSIQFVCYGMHPRGLVWSLVPAFQEIVAGLRTHIFLHELWLGANSEARWKEKFIGRGQRQGVIRLLKELNVRSVHTSNPAYRAALESAGVRSEILPLFGSVPVPDEPANPPDAEYVFVLFGTLHPVWNGDALLKVLKKMDRPIRVIHVGNMGEGEAVWNAMVDSFSPTISFEREGELEPAEIASIFQRAHFGIATTPWEIIGKSASATAMLEHGLPVIVNRDDVHYPGWTPDGYSPQLIKMGKDLLPRLQQAQRTAPNPGLPVVADRFLARMQQLQDA